MHADGEIWAETLWDLREALEVQLGPNAASSFAELLITDGIRLSPPEPSYLDMRNAILLADELDVGGALHELVWSVFKKRGMGYFAGATDGGDTQPIEDFSSPPDPNAARGSITGRVINADSGLPISGVLVGLGGHATATKFFAPDEFFADATDANGRYTIAGVPVGTYPKLGFRPSAGFDAELARDVTVTEGPPTVRNAAMRRDWSSLSGGALIRAVSDDTAASAGCGARAALDQSQGTTWSAFNPDSDDPDNPHAGPPTLTIELPDTIDVSAFLMDPSAGCRDGVSASTRLFRIETSPDGTTFHTAYDGTGAKAFTDSNVGQLNRLVPTGANRNVRFVRVTLLAPLRVDPQCTPNPCSGTDFIDLTELEVLGGRPNVLPSGTLAVSDTSVTVRDVVRFAARFSDPDSAIVGYDWDFDGNGSVDRTTASATTAFAYASPGTFSPKVTAKDFRGGGGAARASVKVSPAPQPPSFPALADITIPRRGTHGVIRVPVTCHAPCTVKGKLAISRKLARRLRLKSRTLTSKTTRTQASTSFTVRIPRTIRRAARRRGLKAITAKLTMRAAYEDGRRRLITRTVRIGV